MDIEFHYYMTYLTATKAGFGTDKAATIAYACQYVDDNDLILEIDKGQASAYRNYISQTMNILKPKAKLFRIYPLFHFIPGDPLSASARRKDGKMHWLNTTPSSNNAEQILQAALDTDDLYRIGIACHGFADSWAHQNFIGYFDTFNAMDSPLCRATPNIGHADAGHSPDWPAVVWQDKRLLQERVDNKAIFLDAAEQQLRRLALYCDATLSPAAVDEQARELRNDLAWAIGGRDQNNSRRSERIARYSELSGIQDYGNLEITPYDEDLWLSAAVKENVRGLRDRGDFLLTRWDPLTDIYNWKDKRKYRSSDWFRFQEAVKSHQSAAWEILNNNNLGFLELPEF
jgi:hypothetical protein